MGLSLTQMVILLAIVLSSRMVPSRATVGRWVHQSAQQSSAILRVLDRACQRWVLVLCLDEIFFHREPILMEVEPLSPGFSGVSVLYRQSASLSTNCTFKMTIHASHMRIVRGCLQEHSSATTISHQWQRCWCGGLFLTPPASDLSIARYRHELVIFTAFSDPLNDVLAGKAPLAADTRGGNLTLPGQVVDRL